MYSKYVLTGGKSKDDDKGLVYVHGDLVYSCPGGAAKYRVHVPHHKDCPGIEDPFAVCKCDYRADMAVPEYDEGGSQVRLVSHSVAGVFSEWLIKKDHTEGWQYSVAIPVHRDAAADALDRGRAPMYQHQPPFCKVCHFLDASIATGTATFNMHRLSGTIWGYDAVVIVSREEIDSREVHSISQAVFTRLIDCISSEMGILCGVPACYVNANCQYQKWPNKY